MSAFGQHSCHIHTYIQNIYINEQNACLDRSLQCLQEKVEEMFFIFVSKNFKIFKDSHLLNISAHWIQIHFIYNFSQPRSVHR